MIRSSHARSHTVAALLALLIVAFTASHAATAKPAAERFAPHAEADDAPALRGSTWHQEDEAYVIRLQQIDDAGRQAYIQRLTGLPTDPFTNRPGVRPRFLSFLLELENRGDGSMQMNPIHCWLMTNRKEIETPLGLTDLSFLYRIAGAELPPAYEKVGPLLLDRPVIVPPGESVHGLLVYRNFKPNTKRYHVDVQLALPDGNVARFSAPYRRVKAGAANEEP